MLYWYNYSFQSKEGQVHTPPVRAVWAKSLAPSRGFFSWYWGGKPVAYHWYESSGKNSINSEDCVLILQSFRSGEPAQYSFLPSLEKQLVQSHLHVTPIAKWETYSFSYMVSSHTLFWVSPIPFHIDRSIFHFGKSNLQSFLHTFIGYIYCRIQNNLNSFTFIVCSIIIHMYTVLL